MNNFLNDILKTIILVFVYCIIWMVLEKHIYGEIQTRTVDDIMMLLMIPIFYLAVKNN